MVRGRSWIAISALALGAAPLLAQGPGGFGPGGPGGPGPRGFGFGPRGVVAGEPYTAQSASSSSTTLSDGTTVRHSNTTTSARDAQGRTVEIVTSTEGSTQVVHTTVFDPVAHTRSSWSTREKVVMVEKLPNFEGRGPRGAGAPGSGTPAAGGPPTGPRFAGGGLGGPGGRFHAQVSRQTLPGQTIAGVYATGEKTTITVPAGAEGNDKPLVSTREVWSAPELKIMLSETSSSPREGNRTYTVNSLTQGEPNASLFQPPSGYTTRTASRGGFRRGGGPPPAPPAAQ